MLAVTIFGKIAKDPQTLVPDFLKEPVRFWLGIVKQSKDLWLLLNPFF
jgi:hypothetical protein